MAIDAHVHVWQLRDPHPVPICESIAALARDFTLDDLAAAWAGCDVARCILIEAGATPGETELLLDLHRRRPDVVAGVVGWTDLSAPSLPSTLDRWMAQGGLVGVREIVAFGDRTDAFLSDEFQRGLSTLADRGLCFEIVVRPDQLELARTLALRHPGLRFNVNHGGRPLVMCGEFRAWADGVRRLARAANATCKLSGLIERAGFEWSLDSLGPYVRHLLDVFGPERLMFASNWPVMTVAGTYTRWWNAVREILDRSGTSADDRRRIFGGSATTFYKLQ